MIDRVVGVALNAAVDKTVSVERLEPGAIHRPVVRSVVPGGKAANVVRAARHLGLDGTVVAVLGGHAGAWYREALVGLGIGLYEAWKLNRRTELTISGPHLLARTTASVGG